MLSLRRALLLALFTFFALPSLAYANGAAFSLSTTHRAFRPLRSRATTGRRRQVADHHAASEPAEAGLRACARPTARTSTSSTRSTASTSSPDLDPVLGPDRSDERQQLERLPRPAAGLPGDRDQPDRLGACGQHAARRIGPAAAAAHGLRPRRHDRRPGRNGQEHQARVGQQRTTPAWVAGEARGPDRRGEHLHDPERDGAARAGAAPDQGVDAGAGRFRDRHRAASGRSSRSPPSAASRSRAKRGLLRRSPPSPPPSPPCSWSREAWARSHSAPSTRPTTRRRRR